MKVYEGKILEELFFNSSRDVGRPIDFIRHQ